jgi:O-antigen/teichoic acid export membrane protein
MRQLFARLYALCQKALGASSPLVLARLLSAALTFGLPLALVRLLEPEAFGTYKQFFLVVTTILLIGQFGLTQSLYYFLPRGGKDRGTYLTHTLILLWPLAALVGVTMFLAAPQVAGWVGSGELVRLRLPLALASGLMLAAAPLEGALTSDRRIGGAALSYVLNDAVRASALVAAAKWGIRWLGPSAIFWAAAGVAALRLCALGLLVARGVLPIGRPDRARLREQLLFALPFAGASLLYVGQRFCSQYVVSARFDAATFALFTIAAFHLPVVDIVFTPISEVMMVQLGTTIGRDDRASLAHWDDAADKLASILFPAACGAWLLGPTVLPMLFTHKYAGAVPLFVLATIEMPLWILPVDALLRAAGDTRFLFAFNAVRIVMTTALVFTGIHLGGLGGAIVGGIVSESVARVVMIGRGRRFLGSPGLHHVLDWPYLGRVALSAALACAPAWVVRLAIPSGLRMVLVSMVVYGAAYLGLRALLLKRPRPRVEAVAVPA